MTKSLVRPPRRSLITGLDTRLRGCVLVRLRTRDLLNGERDRSRLAPALTYACSDWVWRRRRRGVHD